MNSMLLRGGRVIDPASGVDGAHDVLVRDGEIEAVELAGSLTPPEGVAIVDVHGCWVVPGFIDAHVHLRDPGFPEKETIASGLRAAAAGGFTAVAAMANTSPVNDSPAITRYMIERAKSAHCARLIPVSAVTFQLYLRHRMEICGSVLNAERPVVMRTNGRPLLREIRAARMNLSLSWNCPREEFGARPRIESGNLMAGIGRRFAVASTESILCFEHVVTAASG